MSQQLHQTTQCRGVAIAWQTNYLVKAHFGLTTVYQFWVMIFSTDFDMIGFVTRRDGTAAAFVVSEVQD